MSSIEKFLPRSTREEDAWRVLHGDGPTIEEIEAFRKQSIMWEYAKASFLNILSRFTYVPYTISPREVSKNDARKGVREKAQKILGKLY